MKITEIQPDVRAILGVKRARHRAIERRAAIRVTHDASVKARARVQSRIRAVGLGNLAKAVGQTSMQREKSSSATDNPYGVIFARGGDDTLGGGALDAYSQGVNIRPQQGNWLAFPTAAIPRYISMGGRRMKITPQLYRASGLVSRIGKLIFRQIDANRAVLLVERVTVSPKNGRALADRGGRVRTRVREDAVVAFQLIRNTRRGKRFDKDQEVAPVAAMVPDELAQEVKRLAPDFYD